MTIPLYPAQSNLLKFFFTVLRTKELNDYRAKDAALLVKEGYVVREIVLKKNGICYSGLLIGHSTTISNKKWVVQATGNGEPIEHSAIEISEIYRKAS